MKTLNDHIQEILIWFDFDKVKRVMDFLDWKWAFDDEVPSIEQIKQSAIDRMNDAYKSGYSSSGGFSATYTKEDNYMILAFDIADWHSDDHEQENNHD